MMDYPSDDELKMWNDYFKNEYPLDDVKKRDWSEVESSDTNASGMIDVDRLEQMISTTGGADLFRMDMPMFGEIKEFIADGDDYRVVYDDDITVAYDEIHHQTEYSLPSGESVYVSDAELMQTDTVLGDLVQTRFRDKHNIEVFGEDHVSIEQAESNDEFMSEEEEEESIRSIEQALDENNDL